MYHPLLKEISVVLGMQGKHAVQASHRGKGKEEKGRLLLMQDYKWYLCLRIYLIRGTNIPL